MKNYIHNLSVVVEENWVCEWNCPGCNYSAKKLKLPKTVLSKEEIIFRIEYLQKEFEDIKTDLVFHPAETLFKLPITDIVEIIKFANEKYSVQLEFLSLNEKILELLKNWDIKNLIKEKKLFFNLSFDKNKKDLFEKILKTYAEIAVARLKEDKDINYVFSDWINEFERMEILEDYFKKDPFKKSCYFGINSIRGWEKELIALLNKFWFELSDDFLNEVSNSWWDKYLLLKQAGLIIILHYTMEQKIDKYWNNIWNIPHVEWKAICHLMNTFELSVWAWWDIVPHLNPCINHLKFWKIWDSREKIEESFYQHIFRIQNLMIKYWWKKWFNQSELCRMCKEGVDVGNITLVDYYSYLFRKIMLNIKIVLNNIKKSFAKQDKS